MTGSGFEFLNFRFFWAILETAVTLVLWTFAFFYYNRWPNLFSPQRSIRKSLWICSSNDPGLNGAKIRLV
jgi:hypothetical protein